VVPIAGVSTAARDMHIRADVSGTHVVADVTGYFTRFPTEEFEGGVQTKLKTTANTTIVELGDGGCKELTSCTVTTTAAGQVMVEAWAQVVTNHTSGTLDRFIMQVETTASVSCPENDSVDASDYEIPAALGTNIDVDFTLSHARVFVQAAGQTQTYRLSGQMVDGAGTLDQVENSRVLCTFIPNSN
jgi:predicted phage gp36 major capsid-like protein